MWKYQDYTHTQKHMYILINKRTHTTVYAWEALTKNKNIYQSIFISPTIMKNSKVKEVDGLLHLLLFPLRGMKKGLIFFVEWLKKLYKYYLNCYGGFLSF